MEINEQNENITVSDPPADKGDLIFPGWLRKYGIDPDKKVEYMVWEVDSYSVVS
jgi:hypothetical protein